MTMRHTLLLLAATAAPLYAQQDTAALPAPAQEAPAAGETPAAAQPARTAAPDSRLDRRVNALPALALMPADVDMVTATGNLSPIFGSILPINLPSHLSIAIGSSGITTDILLQALNSTNLITSENETLFNTLLKTLGPVRDQKIAPAYIILNFDDQDSLGQTPTFPEYLAEDPDMSIYCTPAEINGFTGVKFDLTAWVKDSLQEEEEALTPESKAWLEALQGRSLYVMSRQEGISRVLAIAEDPAELKLAATPAESVLATDKIAEADSTPDGLLLFCYAGPQACQRTARLSQETFIAQLSALLNPQLTVRQDASEAEKEAIQKARQGFEFLKNAYLNLKPESIIHPCTIKLWYDGTSIWDGGSIHWEQKSDAGKAHFEQAPQRLVQQSQDPMTALYLESTACKVEGAPTATELLTACEQLAAGLAVGSQEGTSGINSAELKQALALYQMFKPQLLKVGEGLGILQEGLGNSAALVVKAQPDPQFPAAAACYAPVTNGAKLTEGWKLILDTVTTATIAFGGNTNILPVLSATGQEIQGGHSYTIALPNNTPACTPTVFVTENALVLSSTPELSTELEQTATGTQTFSGVRLTLNLEPTALIARSVADRMLDACDSADAFEDTWDSDSNEEDSKPEAEAREAETSEEETTCSNGENTCPDEEVPSSINNGTTIEEDDYDSFEDDEFLPPSDEEEAAYQADEIASALEFFALYVRSINLSTETKNGQLISRIDISMRQ